MRSGRIGVFRCMSRSRGLVRGRRTHRRPSLREHARIRVSHLLPDPKVGHCFVDAELRLTVELVAQGPVLDVRTRVDSRGGSRGMRRPLRHSLWYDAGTTRGRRWKPDSLDAWLKPRVCMQWPRHRVVPEQPHDTVAIFARPIEPIESLVQKRTVVSMRRHCRFHTNRVSLGFSPTRCRCWE